MHVHLILALIPAEKRPISPIVFGSQKGTVIFYQNACMHNIDTENNLVVALIKLAFNVESSIVTGDLCACIYHMEGG